MNLAVICMQAFDEEVTPFFVLCFKLMLGVCVSYSKIGSLCLQTKCQTSISEFCFRYLWFRRAAGQQVCFHTF